MSKSVTPQTAQESHGMNVQEAKEWYLAANPDDLAQSTMSTYKHGISAFAAFLEAEGYSLQTVTKPNVMRFGTWLKEFEGSGNDSGFGSGLNPGEGFSDPTLESYTKATKRFLEALEDADIIDRELSEAVPQLTTSKSKKAWDVEVPMDRLEETQKYLREHHYGTRNAAIFEVLMETGMRKSGLRALDVGDVHGGEIPYLDVRDRDGTPLKNGENHEREVAISQDLYESLREYVNYHREPAEEENGRKPLFTTGYGGGSRVSPSTVSDVVYQLTSPATFGIGSCSCSKPPNRDEAIQCEKSVSPHVLRKRHATHLYNEGAPLEEIAGRMAVKPDTLELHYKRSKKSEERERRVGIIGEYL